MFDERVINVLEYSTPNKVATDDAEMKKDEDQFGHKVITQEKTILISNV